MSSERDVRAPADVLRVATAAAALILALVLGLFFGDALAAFMAQLLRGLDALPSWLITGMVVVEQILGLVLMVGGLALAVVHRRWRLVATALAGALAAVAVMAALWLLFDDLAGRPSPIEDAHAILSRFPTAANLAAITGLVTAAAPWVTRRWRRWWWALVFLMAFLHLFGAPVASDTGLALLSGWFAGAAVVALGGAPSRRPTQAAVAVGLESVGVSLATLDRAKVDARGSTPYFGTTTDGSSLFVKVLGVDQRSADLLFRLYRRVQPRDLGDERPFSSLRRAVEHEALVALMAGELGARTPHLVAFAGAEPNGFVLAYAAIAGRSLDRLTAEEMTDDVVGAVWAQVALLRRHRVAHRDLRLANTFLADDGAVWIIDFGFSELAASDLLLANDVAELLASSCTRIGAERAVRAGLDAVGPSALAGALDRLQLPMLSGATRTALKQSPGTLEALRERVLTVSDVSRQAGR